MPSLVIFDCDGVLVDSEILACQTVAACVVEIGIPLTADEVIDRYLGLSMSAMLTDLERHVPGRLPADFAMTLQVRVLACFAAALRPIEGVAAAIDALGCAVCVASSSRPERIRQSLSLTGLLPQFEPNIFSATQVAQGKPAPDLFLFAAASMGVPPGDCLVIEDSAPGVQAGCAAGIPVLGFTGGGHCRPGHAERLIAAGAAACFARMSDLPALFNPGHPAVIPA